jgi:L,D-transpeptidase ErfK/SrfK
MLMPQHVFLWIIAFFISAVASHADEYVLPPSDLNLVGEIHYTLARHEDTFADMARRYDLGRNEIIQANPGVDPWLPGAGTRITLPTRYILPDAPHQGIVLNLPEMRLFYFPPAAAGEPPRLITHPVSIGRMDWKTPLGTTQIVAKQKNPPWRPPLSVREEAAQDQRDLPELVPPGPDNPLGAHALRLGLPGYLMHGTNKPYGLGMRVTHGCIRLYPEDIARLYEQVPLKTPVYILNDPVKLGWLADTLFIEIHPPLEEDSEARQDLLRYTLERIYTEREKRPFIVDGEALKKAVEMQSGIPTAISRQAYVP